MQDNGVSISINNRVAEWDADDTPDGYTIIPSYVAPAIIVAAMSVHKVLTNSNSEMGYNLDNLFNFSS